MAELYSQYASGVQFTAGAIVGSALGTSGINPLVDRLNSITQSDNNILITGSFTNNKTSYWNCIGLAFKEAIDYTTPASNLVFYSEADGSFATSVGNSKGMTSVNGIPNGAIITGAIVYASAGGASTSWILRRTTLSDGTTSDMATGEFNVEDTTITNGTVDNSVYSYWIFSNDLDASKSIYGARITYTTNWI